MHLLNKFVDPVNFSFAESLLRGRLRCGGETLRLLVSGGEADIYHVRLGHSGRWPRRYLAAPLPALPKAAPGMRGTATRLAFSRRGEMTLRDARGRVLLESMPGRGFGISGKSWIFRFRMTPDMRFYGLGEKSAPFERSHRNFRFWNVDAWGDHGPTTVRDEFYDPDYISVPYLIVKRGDVYCGLLIDNAFAGMVSTFPKLTVESTLKRTAPEEPNFFLGAREGEPSLYILHGPSLPELTRKLQRLVGVSPLPPLWALGNHQCRWGYASYRHLKEVADRFERHRFPADGLWLDIDYMRGYRVFTFDPAHFPDPPAQLARLRARGFRVVPILDPGVKQERGYPVYESGRKLKAFCRNPAGGEFAGIVWPGHTVFPDFSREAVRVWWARLVADFARLGVDGAWLDMNEPATGPTDPADMLFGEEGLPHAAWHNQYALLMAMATREGFLSARPDVRPFLISRSGFTGIQRFSGNWTGDNFSTYRHLHLSIGRSLNLALSGAPFNAADVGGFGGSCPEALLLDWYKAAFLFPFFRNHSLFNSRKQEPWAYGPKALRIARRYVRLRYKLLPYLYNLFVEHEETGEAALRPLFYDFKDTPEAPLEFLHDQFMVGPHILQAPFTTEKERERRVTLPKGRWWDVQEGRWIRGNRKLAAPRRAETTPIYLREGALLPMQRGVPVDNRKDLRNIELHVLLSPGRGGVARGRYACDDGETYAYRRGGRTVYALEARAKGRDLVIRVRSGSLGFGPVDFEPVTLEAFRSVILIQDGVRRVLERRERREDLWARDMTLYSWRDPGAGGD